MAVCMDDILDNVLIEQNDELLALQSIYEENFHLIQEYDQNNNTCFEFNLVLNVHHPYEKVTIEAVIPEVIDEEPCSQFEVPNNLENTAQDEDVLTSENNLDDEQSSSKESPIPQHDPDKEYLHIKGDFKHLTPINLWCRFPTFYPQQDPPQVIISCEWLSCAQIDRLSVELHQLWQENCSEPIVFTWADWLQNSSWEFLELPSHLILGEGFKSVALEVSILNIFLKSRPICEICLEAKEGQEFCWFDKCHHFCCRECLKLHCEMHIQSGSVLHLLCPTHGCDAVITPEVLKGILEEDTYQRWERLLLSRTLDMMPDLFYCPRCNAAVVAHEDVGLSRLGQCATCYYAFCTECHGSWHHGRSCIDMEEVEENNQHKKTKKEKQHFEEKKNAKKKGFNLLIMEMRLKGLYRKCPKCKTIIEKNGGCNHMTCARCGCQFCWICENLVKNYTHFGNCISVAGRATTLPKPTEGELIIEKYKVENPGKNVRTKYCPTCSQQNLKVANNNHIKCWSCKTQFCYKCAKKIQGISYKHFMSPNTCTQHSDD